MSACSYLIRAEAAGFERLHPWLESDRVWHLADDVGLTTTTSLPSHSNHPARSRGRVQRPEIGELMQLTHAASEIS